MSLDDYMKASIFEPMGLTNISMFPTAQMKKKLAFMHQRSPDGSLYTRDHPFRLPLIADAEERKSCFNSGGAGCFANPQEYCRKSILPKCTLISCYEASDSPQIEILATLLNNGVSPKTGAVILHQSTIDEMFTNQIPEHPNFARKPIEAAKPDLVNNVVEFFPQPHYQEQGWGLTFMITPHPAPTGRGANAVHWAGLPNLWWWCDREKGVAGMICTQILPAGDEKVNAVIGGVERTVYQYFS